MNTVSKATVIANVFSTKEYSQFINKMALAHNRSIKAILYRLNNYEQPVKLVPIVPV